MKGVVRESDGGGGVERVGVEREGIKRVWRERRAGEREGRWRERDEAEIVGQTV